MRRAIYLRFIIIILATALFSGIISGVFSAVDEDGKVRERTVQLCRVISYEYESHKDAKTLSEILSGERVTIISPQGDIIDDSSAAAASMENHADRREVQNAGVNYIATDSRASSTLGRSFMYAAVKAADGNILRAAHEYGGIWSNMLAQLPAFLITFFAAGIVMLFLANALTKRILRPLESFTETVASGEFDKIPESSGYDEIDGITVKIKDLLNEITHSQNEVEFQQRKTERILSNIKEGIILLDGERNIILINDSAAGIFSAGRDILGSSIFELTRNRKIEEAVEAAISEGKDSIFDYKTDYTVFSVHISQVHGNYLSAQKNGVVILLVDVGAERISQTQRSEFFTNASHELKTPVTTLMGLSEMLKNGMLDDEKKQQIYARIHAESVRISTLINDILTISRLEANAAESQMTPINLAELACEVAGSYEAQASAADVRLTVDAEDVAITSNRTKILDLLGNLLDNAIKYNTAGGLVSVRISSEGSFAVIEVKDTGIGIEREEQSRIFERFYRVDTGSEKIVKGTGLGLSIVKHIVQSLGGKISLLSEIGKGTEIIVRLPM